MLPREKWLKILVISAYILLIALGLYLFFSKLLSLVLPFILAFMLGRGMKEPTEKLHKRLRLPRGLISSALVTAVIFFFAFVIFLLGNQLVSEVVRLFEMLSASSESILEAGARVLGQLEESFPFIYEYLDRDVINGTVTELLKNSIASLSAYLASLLTAFVGGLPDIALFFTVFVIASYYFAADNGRIHSALFDRLPQKQRQLVTGAVQKLKKTGSSYMKAYMIIFLITFAQLFLGFLILRVSYATTLALIIALLDMLPIIGTGTVLIPWGIVLLLMGNYGTAVGIFILFGVLTLSRELLEPRIVGHSLGMHPLLTLISMYSGYKLFGIWGILLLPICVNLTKELFFNKD